MSVTVLVTQARPSLPGGMPCVELPRFLVNSFQSSLDMWFSLQVRHQLAQIHFCVSRLKAAFHRDLHPSLVFRSAHTLEKKIGVALNVLGRSERDRIDSVLNHRMAGGGKTGNAKRERSHEITEFTCRQCSVDPAIALCNLSIVIIGAQHNFERPPTAHEAREVLSGARSGNHTKRRLELTENRRLARGKAHVAGEYELAAHAANAPLDLSDGNKAAGAQVPKDLADRGFSVELRCRLAVLLDPSNVNVGNEVVRVSALKHDHPDRVVGLSSLNERD